MGSLRNGSVFGVYIHILSIVYKCSLQLLEFHKKALPKEPLEKEQMAEKLQDFGISLQQYKSALEMPDVTL